MKFTTLLVCSAVAAFVFSACSTTSKKQDSCCSSSGKCDTAKKHR